MTKYLYAVEIENGNARVAMLGQRKEGEPELADDLNFAIASEISASLKDAFGSGEVGGYYVTFDEYGIPHVLPQDGRV